jgi:DDE superfamily endonuclease
MTRTGATPPDKQLRKFTFHYKLLAVKRIDDGQGNGEGIRPLAKTLGINPCLLVRWRQQEEVIRHLAETRGVNGRARHRITDGRPSSISKEVQTALLLWFDNERDNLLEKMTIFLVICKLRELVPAYEEISRDILRKRLWRVFKRNEVTLRKITHQAQLSRNCAVLIADWGEYIRYKMNVLGIEHNNLCNFDETNVFFSPDSKKTLSRRGLRSIIVTQSESSQRCTVMIGVSGSGHKFPPYLIFKGKSTGRIVQDLNRVNDNHEEGSLALNNSFPVSSFYAIQNKAWMDSTLMLDWVEKVLRPWCLRSVGPTMLILDEFSAHLTSSTRQAIADCGCHLETIPGGYTWKLQVMDVGINKPFKGQFRDRFDHWDRNGIRVNGKKPPAKRHDVALLVRDSFNAITQATIENTWRKVGLPLPVPMVANHENDGNNDDGNNGNNDDDDDEDDDEDRRDMLRYIDWDLANEGDEEIYY